MGRCTVGGIASIAGYVAAALALIAGLHTTVGAYGQGRTASRAYLAVALCAIALALALAAPTTLVITARLEPIPNATGLVGDVFAITGAWGVLGMLAHATSSPNVAIRRIRLATAVLIACAFVMAALFVAARTRFTGEFATVYATNPFVILYERLYIGYMCWGMVNFLRLIGRCVRHEGNRITRLSMRMNVAAAGIGLLWAAWKVGNLGIIAAVGRPFADQAAISEILAAAVIGLIATGVTVPSWMRWVARTRAWHDYHALAPLWELVTSAVPQVLLPGNALDEGIEYALYRRVIEIRDAQRILQPYVDPDVIDLIGRSVESSSPARAALIVEAAELAAALAAYDAGRPQRTEPAEVGAPRQGPIADLHSEARWLVRVAHVMRERHLQAARQTAQR